MALGPIHCGSFLLLAATVLLVVASSEWRGSDAISSTGRDVPLTQSVSAPIVDHISFLNIYNGGQESTFGVFGYCTNVQVGPGSSRLSSPRQDCGCRSVRLM